jgi:hypothetical protein
MIEVKQSGGPDPVTFEVKVAEDGSESHHQVTASQSDMHRLSSGAMPSERVIEAAFQFLLDREPKEAILRRFDITVISRYFPDFETRLPDYLSDGPGGDAAA